MGHDHSHDDPKSYFVEQLCTIGICGAMGAVAVLMSSNKELMSLILSPIPSRKQRRMSRLQPAPARSCTVSTI